MRVLIGLDDSPYSEAALDFVGKMDWPAGTRMVVASAVRVAEPIYSEAELAAGASFRQQALEDGIKRHEELVSRAEKHLKERGFRTEGKVLQGDPRESLIDTARTTGADLLVVGSHGRTGLAKMLMGSVAAHIVAHAPCSVLVVKRQSKL